MNSIEKKRQLASDTISAREIIGYYRASIQQSSPIQNLSQNLMNFRLVIILSVVTLLLFGCVRTYRIDIQQGNIVTPEQIEQLKPGMKMTEVRYLLGAPLVEDPFHTKRWDYFYSFRSGKTLQVEQQRLTVYFDNGQLKKIGQGFELESPSNSSESSVQPQTKHTKPGFLKRSWRKLWPLGKTQSN